MQLIAAEYKSVSPALQLNTAVNTKTRGVIHTSTIPERRVFTCSPHTYRSRVALSLLLLDFFTDPVFQSCTLFFYQNALTPLCSVFVFFSPYDPSFTSSPFLLQSLVLCMKTTWAHNNRFLLEENMTVNETCCRGWMEGKQERTESACWGKWTNTSERYLKKGYVVAKIGTCKHVISTEDLIPLSDTQRAYL